MEKNKSVQQTCQCGCHCSEDHGCGERGCNKECSNSSNCIFTKAQEIREKQRELNFELRHLLVGHNVPLNIADEIIFKVLKYNNRFLSTQIAQARKDTARGILETAKEYMDFEDRLNFEEEIKVKYLNEE